MFFSHVFQPKSVPCDHFNHCFEHYKDALCTVFRFVFALHYITKIEMKQIISELGPVFGPVPGSIIRIRLGFENREISYPNHLYLFIF